MVTGCIDTVATNWVTDVTGKRIAVPEAFFKAVLLRYQDEGGSCERYEARAWIVENRNYGFRGFDQKAEALDNLSTKWTIWHFYGDKKSIIPALVPVLQYP